MKLKEFLEAVKHADENAEIVIASLNDDCSINEENFGVLLKNNKIFIVKDANDFHYMIHTDNTIEFKITSKGK